MDCQGEGGGIGKERAENDPDSWTKEEEVPFFLLSISFVHFFASSRNAAVSGRLSVVPGLTVTAANTEYRGKRQRCGNIRPAKSRCSYTLRTKGEREEDKSLLAKNGADC